ncbi:MAG TPA: hypothetical protein VFZ83_10965 [Acidimicrobiia bacterium]|nr:hypothetical protein [Acidimicrobiia bacterium]
MDIWIARVAWIVLPFTLGRAIGDAIETWTASAAFVAEVLAWAAWTVGAFALFAPRPWGLTALRILCADALVIAITCAWWSDAPTTVLAFASVAVACVGSLGAAVAMASVAALDYGDERRHPLRVPFPLLLAPVPAAAVAAGAGFVAPVLVLANDRLVLGAALGVIGVPMALAAIRMLHALVGRLLVFVPAGLVVVDPFTLTDPVLLSRGIVARVAPRNVVEPPPDALDLRVGTVLGSLLVVLSEPASASRRRGRRDAELIETNQLLVAVVRPAVVTAMAHDRLQTA